MKNPNLYLPGFHLATLRRKPRSASQKLADKLSKIRRKSISQLAKCFTDFVPVQILQPHPSGAQSRRRLFSKENTFWVVKNWTPINKLTSAYQVCNLMKRIC